MVAHVELYPDNMHSQPHSVWQIISVFSIKQLVAARGYSFFIVILYLMVGGLVAAVALCVQVGYSVNLNVNLPMNFYSA